jgi:MYXO-CTERM domain-containing protein
VLGGTSAAPRRPQEDRIMPDIWTKHPEIVRDLLKEAGFTCGANARFLKPRDPAWTCIYDGKTMKGDRYIHNVSTLRSDSGDWTAPVLALAVAAVATRVRRRRRAGSRRA